MSRAKGGHDRVERDLKETTFRLAKTKAEQNRLYQRVSDKVGGLSVMQKKHDRVHQRLTLSSRDLSAVKTGNALAARA